MTSKDLESLEGQLRKGEDFQVIQRLSEVPVATKAVGGLAQQQQLAFLVLAGDVPHVRLRPVPGKALYFVDTTDSPVIEFSPCIWRGSQMRAGRLYFQPRYYEGTQLVEKPERFVKWATWVLSRARKVLTFDRATSAYWGEEAAALRDASKMKLVSPFEEFK